MRRTALPWAGFFLFLFFTGCASVSTFQTGKIIPPKTVELGTGFGVSRIVNSSDIQDFDPRRMSTNLEGWGRLGIVRNVDAGLKIGAGYNVMGTVRGALIQEDHGAPLSIALGLGYSWDKYGDLKDTTTPHSESDQTDLKDWIATLFISKDVTKAFTIFLTPRQVWRTLLNERERNSQPTLKETLHRNWIGGGGGIAINADGKNTLLLEYDCIFDVGDSRKRQTYGGIGWSFRP